MFSWMIVAFFKVLWFLRFFFVFFLLKYNFSDLKSILVFIFFSIKKWERGFSQRDILKKVRKILYVFLLTENTQFGKKSKYYENFKLDTKQIILNGRQSNVLAFKKTINNSLHIVLKYLHNYVAKGYKREIIYYMYPLQQVNRKLARLQL